MKLANYVIFQRGDGPMHEAWLNVFQNSRFSSTLPGLWLGEFVKQMEQSIRPSPLDNPNELVLWKPRRRGRSR